jgi:hypothetical protein
MKRNSRRRTDEHAPIDRIAAISRAQLQQAVDRLIVSFVGADILSRTKSAERTTSRAELASELRRFHNLADALMQWHSNDAFLGVDGLPRPLPWSGKSSLTSLARKIVQEGPKARMLVADLLEHQLVEESAGLYRPTNRSAVLGKANVLNLAYATLAATRLLNTISHNVTTGSPRFYERQVSDVTIRIADLPVFLRFVEQQAQYLIDSVDDWLSRRRISRTTRKDGITVGIGAFAWADAPAAMTTRARSRTSRGTRSRK